VKGTWKTTDDDPPNHAPTILGAVAIVLIIAFGLLSRATGDRPSTVPSPTIAATPSASTPVTAAAVHPVRPRRT
jgi:hypothetical protein